MDTSLFAWLQANTPGDPPPPMFGGNQHPIHWNAFPSNAQLVEHPRLDPYSGLPVGERVLIEEVTGPGAIWHLSRRCQWYNWVRWTNIPEPVQPLIASHLRIDAMSPHACLYIGYGVAPVMGQEHRAGFPNCEVTVVPRQDGSGGQSGPLLMYFGCPHTMVETRLGNAYRKYTCTTCGYTYQVDSSD